MPQSDTYSIKIPRQRGPIEDLSGHQFGYWTVLGYAGDSRWVCRCTCDVERTIRKATLINGLSRSCGCKRRELLAAHHPNDSKRPEYNIWTHMKDRCHNPKNSKYHLYGALGVRVCHRWRFGEDGLTGFQCFIADMGPRPRPDLTVDRKDPRRGYSKGNCRWADAVQQANNKREHYLSPDQREALRYKRRRAHAVLTHEQEKLALKLINKGQHHRDVAAKFSVKPHIIQCLCRAARRRGETVLVWRCKLTPAQRTEVVHQFNSGRTRSELAHEFGVSKRTVATILAEARAIGVKIRRAYSPAVVTQAASAPSLICCAT